VGWPLAANKKLLAASMAGMTAKPKFLAASMASMVASVTMAILIHRQCHKCRPTDLRHHQTLSHLSLQVSFPSLCFLGFRSLWM
jgi:hypothetical protein